MNIFLIEDDHSDSEYIKSIISDADITLVRELPEDIPDEYDLVILDFFISGQESTKLLKKLEDKKSFTTPIIIVSGQVELIKITDIPSHLNAFILSKNENFKEMLKYYIEMVQKRETDDSASFDYKTLFLDLVHDLKNDLGYCHTYNEIENEGFHNENQKKELQEIVIKSSIFAYSRLESLSRFLTAEEDQFASLQESFESIIESNMIFPYRDKIQLFGNVDDKVTAIPSFFMSVILKNLLENSCKNSGDTPDFNIKIKYVDTEVYSEVSITDNGVGMDPAKAKKLFYKKMTSENGHGVGLVVLYRIINSQKGKIVVQSSPGSGTCVFIRFPKK